MFQDPNTIAWRIVRRPPWEKVQVQKEEKRRVRVFLYFKKPQIRGSLQGDQGFPGGASGKEPTCQCRRRQRCRFDTWVRKIPWRRAWQPTPVFLPGESHGQRSLVGYSSWGHRVGHDWSNLTRTGRPRVRKSGIFCLSTVAVGLPLCSSLRLSRAQVPHIWNRNKSADPACLPGLCWSSWKTIL